MALSHQRIYSARYILKLMKNISDALHEAPSRCVAWTWTGEITPLGCLGVINVGLLGAPQKRADSTCSSTARFSTLLLNEGPSSNQLGQLSSPRGENSCATHAREQCAPPKLVLSRVERNFSTTFELRVTVS